MNPESEPVTQPPKSQPPSGTADAKTRTMSSASDASQTSADTAPTGLPTFDPLPANFGRYQVQKLLGAGGMGGVYLAHDSQLDRPVALKIPRFSGTEDPHLRERFLREARAAATLHHANICPVHDVGEVGGVPYLTMGFVEGRSLAELLASLTAPLRPRTVAILMRKLAGALDEAHRHQVIHRDLKPANIMITKRGEPVVMDFGLARRGGTSDTRLTHHGSLMGTPAYMAPEQASGDPNAMGPSCDIYSLGVIFYQILCGRLPFEGDMMAILTQLAVEEPQPPSAHRPGVDKALEAICLTAMAKKIKDRHATMGELAAALTEYLKQEPASRADALVPPPAAQATFVRPLPARHTDAEPAPARRPRRSATAAHRPWLYAGLAAGGALLLVGLLGVGGLVYFFTTNQGTVPIELSDPAAQVEILIDGKPVTLTPPDRTVRLAPGPHVLEVSGKGYRTVRPEFVVVRGANPPLHVTLQPDATAQANADLKQPGPAENNSAPPENKAPPVDQSPPPENKLPPKVTPPEKQPPPDKQPQMVVYTWPVASLRNGAVKLTALKELKPLLIEKFADAKGGLPAGNTENLEKGYLKGKYVFVFRGPGHDLSEIPADRLPASLTGNFAAEVGANAFGILTRWGIVIGDRDHAATTPIAVLILGSGYVYVGPDPRGAGPKVLEVTAVRHPAVHEPGKAQDARNFLQVLVKGRYLEIYVNGIAVIDPVVLPRPISTPRLSLFAATNRGKGAHIDFESVALWPASGIPSLEMRGAIANKVEPGTK
jgi:serine/threonine protein kinase